jgi:hypothetical protein
MRTRLLFTLLILAGGLFMISEAFAQRGPGMMQGRGVLFMDELDLTQEQQLKIAEIMAEHRATVRFDRGTRGRWMAGWENAPREEVLAVLTPAQRQKLEQLRAERQAVNRRFAETYSAARVNRFADEAGIENARKEKLLGITTRQQNAMQALRDEMIDGTITAAEFRVKSEDLRIAHRNEIRDVLSAEEYLMWQDGRRGDRPGWNAGQRRGDGPRGVRPGSRRGMQRGW